jgi:hypothetical protein
MNFSHGEYEYHQSVIDNTRKMVAGMHTRSRIGRGVYPFLFLAESGRPVAIALDTVSFTFLPSVVCGLTRFLERARDPDWSYAEWSRCRALQPLKHTGMAN